MLNRTSFEERPGEMAGAGTEFGDDDRLVEPFVKRIGKGLEKAGPPWPAPSRLLDPAACLGRIVEVDRARDILIGLHDQLRACATA